MSLLSLLDSSAQNNGLVCSTIYVIVAFSSHTYLLLKLDQVFSDENSLAREIMKYVNKILQACFNYCLWLI